MFQLVREVVGIHSLMAIKSDNMQYRLSSFTSGNHLFCKAEIIKHDRPVYWIT